LLGQPAYNFSSQRVEVARHLETHTPRVVVWEIWHNSPAQWSVLGDMAYNFGVPSVDRQTLPSPFGLPPRVNESLFMHSAAYRHLVISLLSSPRESMSMPASRFVTEQLEPVVTDLRARGIQVVFAYMPELDRSFDASARERPSLYRVVDAGVGGSVASVWVAQELAERGVDVVEARVDTCCHYSALGSSVLAEVLAAAVAPLLDAEAVPSTSLPLP
jgi:hypothetical protein